MSNYKQVYKNVGTTPRTMGEAYKNADYAYPIQRFKSEYDDFKEFVVGLLICGLVFILASMVGYSVYVWLN